MVLGICWWVVRVLEPHGNCGAPVSLKFLVMEGKRPEVGLCCSSRQRLPKMEISAWEDDLF
jgi:hypothetical protein